MLTDAGPCGKEPTTKISGQIGATTPEASGRATAEISRVRSFVIH
jgi:hypothetical protein